MAIKITEVQIVTNYSWQNMNELADWNSIKNTKTNWQEPLQTTLVGKQIKIEVEVQENTWSEVRTVFTSWQGIKDSFTNWLGLKNR